MRWLTLTLTLMFLSSAARAEDWKFKISNRTDWKFQVPQEPVKPIVWNSKYYIVEFSAAYCGPCRVFKKNGGPHKLEQAGLAVSEVDIVKHPEWMTARGTLPAVESLPTFWLVDRRTRLPVKTWKGAITVGMVLDTIAEIEPAIDDDST